MNARFQNILRQGGYTLDSKRARALRAAAWTTLFALTCVWLMTVFAAKADWMVPVLQIHFHYVLGLASFIGGVLIVEVKEVIDGNNN